MNTIVRPYVWYKDIWFQLQILKDKSIQYYMFDNMRVVLRYFMPWTYCVKYVCIIENNQISKKISIVTFTKRKDGLYSIAGFIPTKMQNRGYGIYAGIAFVKYFFQSYPNATIYSCSASYNERAFRVTKSMGFQLITQDKRHYASSLTKEQFNNEFVKKIIDRAGIK